MQTRGGYTLAEVRGMAMWEVRRLTAYWQRVPPLRDLVAMLASGIVGHRDQTDAEPAPVPDPAALPEFED